MENQREALIPYYEVALVKNNKTNVVFDRAHNLFLDIALNIGLIGLALYLYFYYFIFKIIKRNIFLSNKTLFLALFVSLSAYLISLFFNFSTVVTSIYFYLLIAIIFSLDFSLREISLDNKNTLPKEETKKRLILSYLILVVVLFLGLWGINRELKNWQADYYYSQIQATFLQGEVATSMELFSYFQESNPLFRDYYEQFVSMVFDNYNEIRDFSSKFLAVEQIKKISPLFSDTQNNSYFYNLSRAQVLALTGDFTQSQEIFTKLESQSPFYSNIYFKQAQLNVLQKDKEAAILKYEQALNLLPEESLVNGDINLNSLLNYKNLINAKMEILK